MAYLNERMWAELFMLNREDLREEIQGLIDRLRLYEAALDTGDEEGLTALLREGREAKTALDAEEAE